MAKQRGQWSGRMGFILAAIGAIIVSVLLGAEYQ